jgi:hypothetical protein
MTYPERRAMAGVVLLVLASAACSDSTAPARSAAPISSLSVVGDGEPIGTSEYLETVNRQAVAKGIGVTVSRAERLLAADAPAQIPRIVFANDRQLRLQSRWVARDPRRLATDATLSYGVFAPLAQATIGGAAEAAFDASFSTWNAVSCSKMGVRKKALAPGLGPSFILTGLFPPADINDVGFVPGALFDLIFGVGASQFTIGVTVTFTFIQVGPGGVPILDPNGNPIPTDIDGDGRDDTAFKEVWFNDALQYTTVGAPGRIDIESAALHEHGHTLELDHFGKIVGDPKTGKLHVSPRAVMNAVLIDTQRSPLGTDNAALCGTYAFLR